MAPVMHRGRSHFPLEALAASILLAGCALAPAGPRPADEEAGALASLRAGDSKEAFIAYRDAARVAPSARAGALHARASVAARRAGLTSDALAERLEAAHASPADRWHKFAAARLYLEAGNPQAALVALGEPLTAWDWLTRGQAERRLGRTADAVGSFARARALDPGMAVADQERGEALASLGRLPESASAYGAALATDPSLTQVQARLAAIEEGIGRTAKAYERYRKLLLVDSGNATARSGRSRLATAEPGLAHAEARSSAESRREWEAYAPPRSAPLPPVPLSPIAVGIVSGASEFRLKCTSACSISAAGKDCETIPALTEIEGVRRGRNLQLTWSGGGYSHAGPIRIAPEDPAATVALFNLHFEKGFYWSDRETRSYRGNMLAVPSNGSMSLVNEVPLEEYLLGVVPSEMPDAWPIDALKAQAVAARTETLKKLRRHSSDGYDVCSTQHCAVYRGTTGEAVNATRAVRETRGEILFAPDGGFIDAVYAANCGGWSSTPGAVWGTGDSLEPVCDLVPVVADKWAAVPIDPDLRERFIYERPEAYCDHRGSRVSFRWSRAYTDEEMAAWALRRYKVEGLKAIRIGTTTDEGWATSVDLVGASTTKTIKRDGIRAALGTIRSNMMTVEHVAPGGGAPGTWIFSGAGWGHGAGMCQDGARGMADRRIVYRDILAHYYPHSRFSKMY